jgi:hypothetical protein
MNAIDDPPTLTNAPLWQRAQAMFSRAIAAVGAPAAIAAIGLMTRSLRRDMVRWLAPLEHIVRKLLLAEAAELHRKAQADLRAAAARAPRMQIVELRSLGLAAHAPIAEVGCSTPRGGAGGGAIPAASVETPIATARVDIGAPDAWRVSFSLAIPRDPRALPEICGPRIRALWGSSDPTLQEPPPAPQRGHTTDLALLLARRFEALRRVLQDPAPHARRLLRRLLTIRHRFRHVVERYANAQASTGDYDPADPRLRLAAWGLALNAPLAFADTS